MASLGRHIIVEYYDCDPALMNDVTHIEQSMEQAAEASGATIINSTFHHFSPYGVSGVVVIQESHLAIHTWPEYGYASVDLFTCGGSVDPWVAYRELKAFFKAGHGSAVEMSRGEMALLEEKQFDLQQLRDKKSQEQAPKRTRDLWFTERDGSIALSLKHDGKLHDAKSNYQKIEVYDTQAYGKVLALDGNITTSEKDEYVYHEMISHVAALSHGQPKRVLVIGGGDGGTARELLKHPAIENIKVVEIDGAVVQASQQYFPQLAQVFDHPKLELVLADGIEFVKQQKPGSFDLVIVDSTDPVGPAEGLFTKAFYQQVYELLDEEGILITQSQSPRFNEKVFKEVFSLQKGLFGEDKVHCYLAYIPTYPSGMWSFSYCAKGSTHPLTSLDEGKADAFAEEQGLQYYNSAIHQAAFALPGYVKQLLNE